MIQIENIEAPNVCVYVCDGDEYDRIEERERDKKIIWEIPFLNKSSNIVSHVFNNKNMWKRKQE